MKKRTHKTCDFIALKKIFFYQNLKRNHLFIYFWPHLAECGILVPWPGLEPVPPAVEAQSLNHWTARDAPLLLFKCKKKKKINRKLFKVHNVWSYLFYAVAFSIAPIQICMSGHKQEHEGLWIIARGPPSPWHLMGSPAQCGKAGHPSQHYPQ